jgi:phosphoglycolate phosphatase-like HAD superfamily hydrolase
VTGERDDPPNATPGEGGATPLPVLSTSQFAEVGRLPLAHAPPPAARSVERGVVLFDLDGTLLDDLGAISRLAGDLLAEAFGTPPEEARVHYLATTGMPFEAQLAQLYAEAPADLRARTARTFHQRKVREAYANASPFPEVPRLLRRLDTARWTLGVTTGAETEMAELILEREGLRYWFEGVLGSADGTKREHLAEYRRRYPGAPMFLVGDSRFDMEAAGSLPGVVPLGRATRLPGWSLTPRDLEGWGAVWADYSLAELPEVLERLTAKRRPRAARPAVGARKRGGDEGRDRESHGRGGPRTALNPGRGIHSPPG